MPGDEKARSLEGTRDRALDVCWDWEDLLAVGRCAGRPEGCVVLAVSAGRKGPARGLGYAKGRSTSTEQKIQTCGNR